MAHVRGPVVPARRRRAAALQRQAPRGLCASASWDGRPRACGDDADGTVVEDEAVANGSALVEVYGRLVRGRVVTGPWADAFSDLVGRSLTLVERTTAPGRRPRPATLVSHASSGSSTATAAGSDAARARRARRARRGGQEADASGGGGHAARRRADALLRYPVGRLDTGVRDRDVLRELIEKRGLRRRRGAPGVYAEVLEPGIVRVGDVLEPLARPAPADPDLVLAALEGPTVELSRSASTSKPASSRRAFHSGAESQ